MDIITQKQEIDTEIEQKYLESTSNNHRKKFAQFFTPVQIADLMANWILAQPNTKTILEPAFGLGVFSRVLLSKKNKLKIQGYELDPKIYSESKKYFDKTTNLNIRLEDYINNDWDKKYDGIICNPPYQKFHNFENKKTQEEIEKNLKFNFNGFTNLYAFFLVKSIYQLNKNGRLAYIIPSEFLNADYGKSVKSYLKKSKTLRHIVVIDFKENVFNDALTTACILFCAKDQNYDTVQFNKIDSLGELGTIEKQLSSYPNVSSNSFKVANTELEPNHKWRRYYQIQNAEKYDNLVPFSTFGKVVRGIATGANKYFKFSKSKAKKYSISEDYLLPCICRSQHVQTPFFTLKDFEKLKNYDKSVYLLNAGEDYDKHVERYLKKGINEEIHERYLTSNRTPWHSLENRAPSPIWVSVFNRSGLKFIRNEANISNLTTFHCIYPSDANLFPIDLNLLFAYLITDIAKEIFRDNQREYGNGLKKFEPNDINKAKALDLRLLDDSSREKILNIYSKYRNSVLKKDAKKTYIDQLNNIFLNNFL